MSERGRLPKAYLRVDPNIDQHPDVTLIVRLLCAANRQDPRGRWKSWRHLCAALGQALAKEAKEAGHVVELDGECRGAWYMDGWDEWQEGDWTVGERMARMRDRKRNGGGPSPGAERTANWRLRNAIFERDGSTCRYCGTSEDRQWLVADHVIPGGPTTMENLVTACRRCNKKKGNQTPEGAGMPLLPVTSSVTGGDTSPLQEEQEAREEGLARAGRRALAILALLPVTALGDHAESVKVTLTAAASCGWAPPHRASILGESVRQRRTA